MRTRILFASLLFAALPAAAQTGPGAGALSVPNADPFPEHVQAVSRRGRR